MQNRLAVEFSMKFFNVGPKNEAPAANEPMAHGLKGSVRLTLS